MSNNPSMGAMWFPGEYRGKKGAYLHFSIWDNGGKTIDRYTLRTEDGATYAFNERPSHPQGFGQYVGNTPAKSYPGWGKRISIINLPHDAQEFVRERITKESQNPFFDSLVSGLGLGVGWAGASKLLPAATKAVKRQYNKWKDKEKKNPKFLFEGNTPNADVPPAFNPIGSTPVPPDATLLPPGAPNPKRLSVFDKHQLRVARKTLNMPDAMVGILGGITKAEAREIIKRLTGKSARENPQATSTTLPGLDLEPANFKAPMGASALNPKKKHHRYAGDCPKCGGLATFMAANDDDTREQWWCPKCSYTFSTKSTSISRGGTKPGTVYCMRCLTWHDIGGPLARAHDDDLDERRNPFKALYEGNAPSMDMPAAFNPRKKVRSYKVAIKVYGEPGWVYNAQRFATMEEAKSAANDLASRWTLVETYEVHPSDDPVNYRWDGESGAIHRNPGSTW